MYKRYKEVSLILKIVIGIIVGAILGIAVPSWSFIDILGKLFVGALKAIAPLLVFFLIMSAISKYRPGAKNHFGTVIILYLSATLFSSMAAVAASYMFPIKLVLPGAMKIAESAPKDLGTVVTGLLTNAVSNPISALVEGNYLAILFWSLLIGSGLRMTSKATKHVVSELSEAISSVAQNVIQFAPFGIVGLLHESLSKTGIKGVMAYGQVLLLLVGTMAFVYLVVYPLMVWVMTRQNPYPLTFWTLKTSGIPAFFTRSGAVNIPINLKAAKDLGLNEESYAISIPLGGSANSGGAAITVSIMTLAAANTMGVQVSIFLALLLCFMSAIASTGVSGIAGGSLLLIPMAASLFGISNDIAMQVVGIGFIIGVVQDSVETAVNSASDLLFTATAEYADSRKEGNPVDIRAAIKAAGNGKRKAGVPDEVSQPVESERI
ncbi:serine threonine transporter SstT [Agrilactobacillus composti DSM 18527 = JCM 14202]|uniref:Serine/threonine transporter SstT n=1 Tax=Agrilactobacillus composti DSM 18527 = JCM 14202 TaxID=1423734 RepID=A0A0R1Y2K2_9LACO|nr:serine/threonine transporter SstT [Agrilactobacillus composti]KRM36241.1 serine threonine transporter SstT [Agrilactobacillus composti DSM 18527 = JCM 14202]